MMCEKIIGLMIAGLLLSFTQPLESAAAAFWPKTIESDYDGRLPYLISYFPRQSPEQKFPLLMILHGAGEKAETYYDELYSATYKKGMILIVPSWNQKPRVSNKDLKALVDEVSEKYPIDKNQIYVAGVSLGAAITRDLVVTYPEMWRGVIFVSLPVESNWHEQLPEQDYPPFFFIHGKQDPYFDADKVVEQTTHLKQRNLDVSILIDPRGTHQYQPSWGKAILQWMETDTQTNN